MADALTEIDSIVEAVFADLKLVAASVPNERLPKEEQIRCCIYATMRPHYPVVCAERSYHSVDDCKGNNECDLWAASPGGKPVWLEFKRCWSACEWINKPPEQLANWKADIEKLRQASLDSDRCFLLMGFFDFDPLQEANASNSEVVRNIGQFHVANLVHRSSRPFVWRNGDGITHVGAWVWRWRAGQVIASETGQIATADEAITTPDDVDSLL